MVDLLPNLLFTRVGICCSSRESLTISIFPNLHLILKCHIMETVRCSLSLSLSFSFLNHLLIDTYKWTSKQKILTFSFTDTIFQCGMSCQIAPIQSLVGQTGRRWVMGVISQFEDGHFYLEDLTASVEINLSKAISFLSISYDILVYIYFQHDVNLRSVFFLCHLALRHNFLALVIWLKTRLNFGEIIFLVF